ncbi:TPA: hypothetical protein P9G65_005815 [Pseudomonas aeruginosa]|nr:hypothetical protein [Pseudomonas aeruginosa]HDQ4723517.1 hypothetical protein [Pseudomonas aeruginosa]
MLIHFGPRILMPEGDAVSCALLDVWVKEFDLHLSGGFDVVACRPYVNKRYCVACRKVGHEAINGLLIQVAGHVKLFTVITRWSIGGEVVLRHRVNYVVLDDQFEAVTDEPGLWSMRGRSRRISHLLQQQDRERVRPFPAATFDYKPNIREMLRGQGLQIETSENFCMPTVEPSRLVPKNNNIQRYLPTIDMAFQVNRPGIF